MVISDSEKRGSDQPSPAAEENAGRLRLPRESNADGQPVPSGILARKPQEQRH